MKNGHTFLDWRIGRFAGGASAAHLLQPGRQISPQSRLLYNNAKTALRLKLLLLK